MWKTRSLPKVLVVPVALSALLALTACSAAESSPTAADRIVIDVRTPEEFALGHLAGARNIDIQGADFDAQIQALDRSASYVVYCRSGNRSGAAIERMTELGFTQTVNGGSVDEAARLTGLAVVS